MVYVKALFQILFGIDEELEKASIQTQKLEATMNGDPKWMLSCEPRTREKIDCNNGNTYQRIKK